MNNTRLRLLSDLSWLPGETSSRYTMMSHCSERLEGCAASFCSRSCCIPPMCEECHTAAAGGLKKIFFLDPSERTNSHCCSNLPYGVVRSTACCRFLLTALLLMPSGSSPCCFTAASTSAIPDWEMKLRRPNRLKSMESA